MSIDTDRFSFGRKIGEIITDIIGDARLQQLMEAGGHALPENKDKPSGQIALEMGVITPDTKTALLVAQAAERTLRLAEQFEGLNVKNAPDANKEARHYNDEVFKFVGSDRDPAILQKAQAIWQIATIAYRALILSHLNNEAYIPCYCDVKVLAPSLKESARDLYSAAKDMLAQEGHTEAADRISKIEEYIASNLQTSFNDGQYTQESLISPAEIAKKLCDNHQSGTDYYNENSLKLGGSADLWSNNQELLGTLHRLAELVMPESSRGIEPVHPEKKLGNSISLHMTLPE